MSSFHQTTMLSTLNQIYKTFLGWDKYFVNSLISVRVFLKAFSSECFHEQIWCIIELLSIFCICTCLLHTSIGPFVMFYSVYKQILIAHVNITKFSHHHCIQLTYKQINKIFEQHFQRTRWNITCKNLLHQQHILTNHIQKTTRKHLMHTFRNNNYRHHHLLLEPLAWPHKL